MMRESMTARYAAARPARCGPLTGVRGAAMVAGRVVTRRRNPAAAMHPRPRRCTLAAWLAFACLWQAAAAPAQPAAANLQFEAEEWSEPRTAWVEDQHPENRWNLWSKDQDADRKWSGGRVLQSPRVMADRAAPEDGAPPLHTRITGLPDGTYDVFMNGTRAIGLSFDGRTWLRSTGGLIAAEVAIADGTFELWVDDRFLNQPNPGAAYFDFLRFEPVRQIAPKPPVAGWARTRAAEKLDRGTVAVTTAAGVHVSWRLLPGDPTDVAFNVYQTNAAAPRRLNRSPVRRTTGWLDRAGAAGAVYQVRPVVAGRELPADGAPARCTGGCLSIGLGGGSTVQKCGLGDLDGDGRLEFVLKLPADSIDPWERYWKPSPGTCRLEAWTAEGRMLWRHDLGWAIERGIWYSPFLVHDLDGDGRAEVAAKVGEGDPRDADGRVTSGPEWVAVLDGLTGRERCRAPWPDRAGFGTGQAGYNHASRNQLAVACLDGKTPCLVTLRGTYTVMKAEAWQLLDGALAPLWRYNSDEGGRRLRGQGAHFTHVADVDADGRDELVLGSVVLDDTGVPLWSTGLGHPDHAYVGDLDPQRPGLEIYYGIEARRQEHGMCQVDARTGAILWGWDQPTQHIHSTGLCSDIDPLHPGAESYGADSADHQPSGEPWLWSAAGRLLARGPDWGFTRHCVWWDADLQREVLAGGRLVKFGGGPAPGQVKGSVVLVSDVLGDWREEVVTSVPGELRIHTTPVPAMDRRTTLLADPLYRLDTALCAMGYTQVPCLTTCLEATAPNLNLTVLEQPDGGPNLRVVASAPLDRAVTGTLRLTATGAPVSPAEHPVDLAPGERTVILATATPPPPGRTAPTVTATLTGPGLRLRTTAAIEGRAGAPDEP